ncbi:HoxN/HupN/NixA family nickel/cobalt transporter [Kineococcus rubinsiae]|uniref:HoxN/HupN/NixA family nickel/cobalt transporter n=1 Tax=Kineococcus rubinsiae TaxID=2609562 RepID=UPI00142FE0B1|nr:HoxN/HupN/NixA family nickel/cobalt transporter [Kineococcus rubinsiae]NIZ89784.1 HoxN/HupN/NixA family nickel/cobalt transporter [Kineococcus rubinsiae]
MSDALLTSATRAAGRRWDRTDSRRLTRLLAVVLGLHVLGWGVLGFVVVPAGHTVGAQVFGWGLGLTAYVFGVRHAFDADHIAVIDGATRKLTADGQRPLSVGFWFSLGHSSVVVAMAVVIATGARFASGLVTEGSAAHDALGVFGTTAAGVFLWVIGLVNLAALLGILRTARQRRRGELDDAALHQRLALDGALARLLARFTRRIRSPRQIYPVGLLMGLGFDTATEVALLVLAGTAAVTLPWYAVLVLPVLFTAGMSLFDTLDGAFMNLAYDWALANPLRRLAYNGVVTGVSVAVALAIGTIQLVSVAHDELHLGDAASTWISGLDTGVVGYAVAALFLLVWLGALVWWRVTGAGRRSPADASGEGGAVAGQGREA